MKLEIDTKHDSKEEIKKVIQMLQHFVGDAPMTNATETSSGSAFTNMFGDNSVSTTESSGQESSEKTTTQSQSGIFNLFNDGPKTTENGSEQNNSEEELKKAARDEISQIEIIPY